MGAFWSQSSEAVVKGTTHSDVTHKDAIQRPAPQTVIKRAASQEIRHSDNRQQKRDRTTSFSSETETQRFIVRCPGLFWLSKRDIARLLSKCEKLPEYGGLHKIARWDYFFLNFRKTDIPIARKALSEMSHRGTNFTVGDAEHPVAKRRRTNGTHTSANTTQTAVCPCAASATAPWADVPYRTQTARKRKLWRNALVTVANRMRSDPLIGPATPWLRAVRQGAGVCDLERLEFCGEHDDTAVGRDYYRNKSEFTIGMSMERCGVAKHVHVARPTIGYSVGHIRNGEFSVSEITERCLTTCVTARKLSILLTDIVRRSGQPVYDRLSHSGYWRQVTCRRSTRTDETLVCIMVNRSNGARPQVNEKAAWTDEECREAVISTLRSEFRSQDRVGLFWQVTDELSPTTATVDAIHVWGLRALTEILLGLKFRIHPTSFFQVNTVMAERLYTVIRDYAATGDNTTVLDICCGTGTIALALAKSAHSVIGVDVCESAISDARHNARMNNITNATFLVGPAEHVIQQAIQILPPEQFCVAVLDPPRAGISNTVISAIRAARAIKRVVYVCCEPANLWRNIISLCRPTSKAFRALPFRPVRAAGVDMFPHTPRGELVVQLER